MPAANVVAATGFPGPLPERFDLPQARALAEAIRERRLVLASASPRRRDLLTRAGVRFEVLPADIPEEPHPDESAARFAERMALEKAEAVAGRLERGALILAADTIVVIDGDILGKPRDAAHAEQLLGRILGREHEVITAFAVTDAARGGAQTGRVSSRVRMRRAASPDEVRAYVATGEPLDKAGAYALQGEGRRFVETVAGSATNVIGLPLEEALELVVRVAQATR